MILTNDNLIIAKNGLQFELRICMPNERLNFLHWDDEGRTDDLVLIVGHRDVIISNKFMFTSSNTKIIRDDSYFRIEVTIPMPSNNAIFHSRKLNLIDAVFERDLLIK